MTDACIDLETTVTVLEQVAEAVRARRKVAGGAANGAQVSQLEEKPAYVEIGSVPCRN
jgi:hypothetical protein